MPTKLPSLYTPQRKPDDRPSPSTRGYGANWQKVRAWKLRVNPCCQDCEQEGVVEPATDVDHIDGDVSNMREENLRSLCKSHHSRKTVACNGGLGHASTVKRVANF